MKVKWFTKKSLLKILIGLIIFYTVLGFWIVPMGIKWALIKKLGPRIQHTVAVDKVRLNPYNFQLRIENFNIYDDKNVRLLGFEQLNVDLKIAGFFKKTYHFQEIELAGFFIQPIISAEGKLNLADMIPAPSQTDKTKPSLTDEKDKRGTIPSIFIDSLKIINGTIHAKDEQLQEPFEYVLRSINIKLEDLNTGISEHGKLALMFNTAQDGKAKIDGNLKVRPLDIILNFNLINIAVNKIQPYNQKIFENLAIDKGLLNITGQLKYEADQNITGKCSIKANMRISDLALRDASEKELFFAWQELDLSDVIVSIHQKSLQIGSITLNGPEARFILEEGGSNVGRVFMTAKSNEQTNVNNGVDLSNQTEVSSQTEPQKEETKPEFEYTISVPEIAVREGKFTLLDKSVTPQFTMTLNDVESKLIGFSTDHNSEIRFTFQGNTDDNGLIQVTGKGFPFKDTINMDMEMSLNNYQMGVLTPYVGKYAGYDVAKGKMNLLINYQVSDSELSANHKILVKDFRFGDKVESEDAIKVPFNLVLSLLQDMRGNINLNFPVSGKITDPEFKYAHLIGKTLTNYFLKIATKPFAFLGSMLSSENAEEDLSYIQFEPGKETISAEEREKLLSIATAINERPLLVVEIPAVFNPDVDWLAIKKLAFQKEYNLALEESTRSPEKILQQMYQKKFGWRKQHKLYNSFEYRNEANKKVFDNKKYQDELKNQLIENAPADKSALKELAKQRAGNVYHILLQEGQVNEKRVKKGAVKEVEGLSDFISMDLKLMVKE